MIKQTLFPANTALKPNTPRTSTKFMTFGSLALLFATCLVGSGALADELQPIQGRSVVLGPVNGIAYYTNDAAGSHVVATLSSGEGSTPIRVVATLIAGQNLTLSVPHGVGEPATHVTFSRQGEHVFVTSDAAVVEAEK